MRRLLLLVVLLLPGCATLEGERLFVAGDSDSAIEVYEQYLLRRAELSQDDAPILLYLAIALADPESERYDPKLSEGHLHTLVNLFPATPEARQASFALDVLAITAELKDELRERDGQILALKTVLESVVATESQLRSKVEIGDEERATLESRIAALTRSARHLSSEIAALENELEALKRIDLETAGGVAAEPQEEPDDG